MAAASWGKTLYPLTASGRGDPSVQDSQLALLEKYLVPLAPTRAGDEGSRSGDIYVTSRCLGDGGVPGKYFHSMLS